MELTPRPPRVYSAAPSHLPVTVVKAIKVFGPGDNSRAIGLSDNFQNSTITSGISPPKYYLHKTGQTDHEYFAIDADTGNITTRKLVFYHSQFRFNSFYIIFHSFICTVMAF